MPSQPKSIDIAINSYLFRHPTHRVKLEEVSVTTKAIRSTQGEHRDLGLQSIQSQQNVVTDVTSQLHLLVTPPLHAGPDSSLSPRIAAGHATEQGEIICVKACHLLSRGCRGGCRCQCHRRAVLRTPRLLERLIGTLFLNYIGILR